MIHMARELAAIPPVARQVCALALPYLDEIGLSDIELALVEALTNAVRHGWAHSRATSEITIKAAIAEDRLTIEILDQSHGFPPHLLDEAGARKLEFDPDDLETLHENGRGLSLIVLSMDEVTLQSSNDEFVLRMCKLLA